MEVNLMQESKVYDVEFKGEHFSVTITTHNNGYTDTYVYDDEGNNLCDLADDSLAQEIIELIAVNA
jgi:hypothetical protein